MTWSPSTWPFLWQLHQSAQSARIIGLVPPVPVERIKAVGNAAVKAQRWRCSLSASAAPCPSIVEYHELSGRGDFNDSFIAVLQFPELDELGL